MIVGVGLPGISLERELVKEYFTRTLSAGFEYAYLYPGINRVLQAWECGRAQYNIHNCRASKPE